MPRAGKPFTSVLCTASGTCHQAETGDTTGTLQDSCHGIVSETFSGPHPDSCLRMDMPLSQSPHCIWLPLLCFYGRILASKAVLKLSTPSFFSAYSQAKHTELLAADLMIHSPIPFCPRSRKSATHKRQRFVACLSSISGPLLTHVYVAREIRYTQYLDGIGLEEPSLSRRLPEGFLTLTAQDTVKGRKSFACFFCGKNM